MRSLLCLLLTLTASAADRPNIVVILADDYGYGSAGCYGADPKLVRTPAIDRLAAEGRRFTDGNTTSSVCSPTRYSLLTGRYCWRTSLTHEVLGTFSPLHIEPTRVNLASLLKAKGYRTAAVGKWHLGSRPDLQPQRRGFDEFFGNLYHLNAEEEPESVDYPKNPEFKKKFGPRGVIHSFADGRIEDTGPLTRKRMETIDEEVNARAMGFMEQSVKADKPFFLWWNSTKMHIFTHLKEGVDGKTGLGIYADGMVEHDRQVGELLAKLEALGELENTIIMYSYAKFPSMAVSKATLGILQDHYPERLGQMLIANPPMLFSTFWSCLGSSNIARATAPHSRYRRSFLF